MWVHHLRELLMPDPSATAVQVRPLTVLHVLPVDLARGAQVYARQLCDALGGIQGGHRLVVLFAGDRVAAHADDELGVPPGVLKRFGYDPRAAVRLWRLVRTHRPQIVVAHGLEPLKYLLPLAWHPRPRLVVYAIGTVHPKAHRGPSRWLYRILLAVPAAVAAVSQEVAQECGARFHVPAAKVHVVHNGRPWNTQRRTAGRSSAHPVVAFVGHLNEGKRPGLFIEAVRLLRDRGVEVDAWLAGDGPLAEALSGVAAAAGVRLLGRREDVPTLLAGSDLFLFTSAPSGEGMPGVLIEAGLAGLPVVATDVPGAATVVQHGVTGFVTPVDDVDALVECAQTLLADPTLRSRMGAAGARRCTELFSLEASARAWAELLSDVAPSVPTQIRRE